MRPKSRGLAECDPIGIAVAIFVTIAIPVIGLAILGIAFKGSPGTQRFAVQFLGVQACVSTYRQISYLFSQSAGPQLVSDTAQIQQVLLLPYWFWGALIAVLSFLILAQSLIFTNLYLQRYLRVYVYY